jgi:tRNA-specific 2-thiouridylase
MTRRIAVAMSGGLDSSVAAALLADSGDEVFGIMLRLWSGGPNGNNRCCSPDDMARARQTAAQLGIPFYVQDVQAHFKEVVVDFFVDGYAQGITPNPCLECNRSIRWGFLLQHAQALGASHLATGHYAQVEERRPRYHLLRAMDRHKDQSYVLSVMGQEQLRHALFPLGSLHKDEVRRIAAERGLAAADRSESQDLCFVGGGDYRQFLEHMRADLPPPGLVVNTAGEVIGQHRGLAHYTIGQRKGIGIAAPQAMYVVDKRMQTNQLVVGPREALGRATFAVHRVNWVDGAPPAGPVEAEVQVRYHARPRIGTVTPDGAARATVTLSQPIAEVSPGQAAVFYHGDVCLGGGIIQP